MQSLVSGTTLLINRPLIFSIANDQKFLTDALNFPEDVYSAAEVLRLVPASLALWVYL